MPCKNFYPQKKSAVGVDLSSVTWLCHCLILYRKLLNNVNYIFLLIDMGKNGSGHNYMFNDK